MPVAWIGGASMSSATALSRLDVVEAARAVVARHRTYYQLRGRKPAAKPAAVYEADIQLFLAMSDLESSLLLFDATEGDRDAR